MSRLSSDVGGTAAKGHQEAERLAITCADSSESFAQTVSLRSGYLAYAHVERCGASQYWNVWREPTLATCGTLSVVYHLSTLLYLPRSLHEASHWAKHATFPHRHYLDVFCSLKRSRLQATCESTLPPLRCVCAVPRLMTPVSTASSPTPPPTELDT